jgi:hypothetical protein
LLSAIAICYLLSAICYLLSAICYLLLAIGYWLLAIAQLPASPPESTAKLQALPLT